MVVVDRLEDLVDGEFGVPVPRLERLRHLVEQQQAGRALGGEDRDPAVPHVTAQLAG